MGNSEENRRAKREVRAIQKKYRPNVAALVLSPDGQILLCERSDVAGAWQPPQGGIDPGETDEVALFRELEEEIGLREEHVRILGCTDGWLRYQLPQHMRRDQRRSANRSSSGGSGGGRSPSGKSGKGKRGPASFKGQKQKWFLLEMLASDEEVRFDLCQKPEFDGFAWVSYWYPVNQVIEFKREVYRRALKQLAPRLPIDQALLIPAD